MRIKAAIVREKEGPFSLETLELDDPRPGEVLVRIVATGVCHTDLVARAQLYPVPLPIVLGHEGAGVVEQVGEGVTKVAPGDHVVLTYASCGTCVHCQQGAPAYCLNLFPLNFGGMRPDGSTTLQTESGEAVHGAFFRQSSFATYALASERNVVKVPQDVPLDILGPLGCGIQTGAGAILNTLRPQAGTSVAVFGVGAVGMSAVMAAHLVGCATIIAVDINPKRLELARELGATHTVNAAERNPVEAIREIVPVGVDFSVEAVGSPTVLRQAVDALKPLGVCGLIGAAPFGTEVSLDMNTVLLGRIVRGVIEGDSVPDIFIPRLIELYRQGRFPFDRLIAFYTLDDINKAAEDSEQGRVVKPVLRMEG